MSGTGVHKDQEQHKKELQQRIDEASQSLHDNPYYRQAETQTQPNWFDRIFGGIRHAWSGITESVAEFFHKRDIIRGGNVRSWFPTIAGGAAALGTYFLAGGLFEQWFKKIPLVGNLLSIAVAGITGIFSAQLLQPLEPRTTHQHLPTGPGTVKPRARSEVIEDIEVPVPQDDVNHKALPPVLHKVPRAIVENGNLNPPVDWKQVKQLQIDVDDAMSTTKIGPGTVPRLSRQEVLKFDDAARGVTKLRLSYQNWEETIRALTDYTSDYRKKIHPAIVNQLTSLEITRRAAESIPPCFPEAPTLYAPAEWNGWKGADRLSTSPEAWGDRACRYLLQHFPKACTTLQRPQQWKEMNVSEKINLLRRYSAELNETVFTDPDNGKKLGGILCNLYRTDEGPSVLKWDPMTVLCFGGPYPGAFNEAAAAKLNLNEWLIKNNMGKAANWTPERESTFGNLLEDCLNKNCFADNVSKERARHIVEWAKAQKMRQMLNRFDEEVHEPNRAALKAYVKETLPRYNEEVKQFRQTMEILEEHRMAIKIPNPKAKSIYSRDKNVEYYVVEAIDCNRHPPRYYDIAVEVKNNKVQAYHVTAGDSQPVRIAVNGVTNIFAWENADIAQVYQTLKPVLAQTDRHLEEQGKKKAIHWVRMESYWNDPNYRDMKKQLARESSLATREEKEEAYMKEHPVYNVVYLVDNRENTPRQIQIRWRALTCISRPGKDFEVRVGGNHWVKVHMDKDQLGLEQAGIDFRLGAVRHILDRTYKVMRETNIPFTFNTPPTKKESHKELTHTGSKRIELTKAPKGLLDILTDTALGTFGSPLTPATKPATTDVTRKANKHLLHTSNMA